MLYMGEILENVSKMEECMENGGLSTKEDHHLRSKRRKIKTQDILRIGSH